MIKLTIHPRGALLPVRVRAGARKNGVVGEHNGMLRVAVTAAPEKGKANKTIVEVLADVLHVSKSSIELVAGDTSPRKQFLIVGADVEETRLLIERTLAS